MIIWTLTSLSRLYIELVAKFGPHDEWGAVLSPGSEREEEFDKFLVGVATRVGCKSPAAVKQQIHWALTKQPSIGFKGGLHSRTYVMNKAAAIDAGFIDSSYLPKRLELDYARRT